MTDIGNAIVLRDGCVLLARRSAARKAYPGLWSFPGGHVERGDREHSELRWFSSSAATSLPDLALEAYRPLFDGLAARP